MRDTCGVSLTRVQVVAVDVGAAVAAADAAEGGDGVSVAVAVAEKEKGGSLLQEQTRHKAVAHLFIATIFSYLYESLLLIVSCPESSCSSPATLKHTFFPLRSPFSPSHSADM